MEKIVEAHVRQFTTPMERVGATFVRNDGTYIRLWAPAAIAASIEWIDGETAVLEKHDGYFTGHFPGIEPGARYWFHLDGKRIADPASRFQPQDTQGPSEVVDSNFSWTDAVWTGVPFKEWVIYEIHPGTFSETHGFDGIVADLPRLKQLGVTTLEIMPVSQFSGDRNWGYDGVFPHAVQHSYGGPTKLKALVDACHAHGLAIILDCVYNHIGPEGNVLFGCGPYVRDKYHTPWGPALNFDGAESDHVRRYFLQSAWQWLTEFHFDGLRLDAVQMIFDNAPVHFLQELNGLKRAAEVQRGVSLILTGESDMNDARLVMPVAVNGLGMDAHWADDFHHCLHATLTGEKDGYYADYGGLDQLAKIYRRGVAFEGDYSPFRKRRHGRSYDGVDKSALIVETQNHDQIGNRLTGERLIRQIGLQKAKLGAACVLLSPFTPFLFMGEELASEAPFTYFISHHEPSLVDAVRKGRAEEWKDFSWASEPPDPAGLETFEACVLSDKNPPPGSDAASMQSLYRRMIELSKRIRHYDTMDVELDRSTHIITLNYLKGSACLKVILSFNERGREIVLNKPDWRCIFSSEAEDNGPMPVNGPFKIAPFSATVLEG